MSAPIPPPRNAQLAALRTEAPPAYADHLGEMISAHALDGTYRYVSAACRELLGYEPGELIGRWAYEDLHPDDVPKVRAAHRSVLDGAPATVVCRLRRKDGAYAWVETTTRAVRHELGAVREIVCCTRPARDAPAHPTGESYEACVARVSRVMRTEAVTTLLQPIVSLVDGHVVAYEALTRFPGRPSRPPDRWFSDAWHVDLGIPLELLAVRTALEVLPHLPADVSLCVNASAETVAAPGFLAALGGDAERVIVEVAEHRQLEDAAFARSVAPLRAAGGRLAIDDFGAGHASLSQVLAVSPDWIKLDLSLTGQVGASPVAQALASALVAFAAEVGLEVIAEGVEDAAQLETLRAIGIRYGQGYHLGRPAPLDALAAGAI